MSKKNEVLRDGKDMPSATDVATASAVREDAQYTPGPWRVQACSHGGAIVVRGSESDELRRRHPQSHLQVVPVADAWLVAAAPELLAALKEAEEFVHWWMEDNTGERELAALERIEAAIAKAEGR